MFSNWVIVNNSLILSIDYSYEFGINLGDKHIYSNMKKEIKKIIKRLNFSGEKIVLTLGGVVLATILVIENPKSNIDLVYTNNSIIPYDNIVLSNVKKENVNDLVPVEDNKKIETVKEKSVNNTVKEENKSVNSVEQVQEKKEESVNNFEESVTIYRKNGQVITLTLEEYLVGVVGAEMPASFNIEALKSQAVISRTYALRSKEIGRKLTDTVDTQVYLDNNELKNKWGSDYDKYYSKIKNAVDSTTGEAIYYNGNLIDAVFHSTSNGKTEDPKYVWGSDIPYLKSVDSNWDINSSSYLREDVKDLENVLNILGVSSSDFNIESRDDSGRVSKVNVGDKSYTGVELRNLLGLRSADFDIEIIDNAIKFTTRGYGHGVGLSQYGANGMANAGYNYKDIIRHYYTGVSVK